jgi:hypothetical protein
MKRLLITIHDILAVDDIGDRYAGRQGGRAARVYCQPLLHHLQSL